MIRTLEAWGRRVWVERDEAAIDEMIVVDTAAHGLGGQTLVGPEGFKSFHRALCALAARHRTSSLTITSRPMAGWRRLCTFTGTSSAGDQRVSITGTIHARIAEGKILEGYNHFDFIGLFTQMGLLPERHPAALLRGTARLRLTAASPSSWRRPDPLADPLQHVGEERVGGHAHQEFQADDQGAALAAGGDGAELDAEIVLGVGAQAVEPVLEREGQGDVGEGEDAQRDR